MLTDRLNRPCADSPHARSRGAADYVREAGGIWVGNYSSDTISKLDLDGTVVGTYATQVRPWGVACSDTEVWATNETTRSVTVRLISDGSLVGHYDNAGNTPTWITYDGQGCFWVSNSNSSTLTKWQASDHTIVTETGGNGYGMTCVAGDYIWYPQGEYDQACRLGLSDYSSTPFTVGDAPYACAFDGSNIWVANGDNTVTVLTQDGQLVGTYATGATPKGMAFDGLNMWIQNSAAGTATVYSTAGELVNTYTTGTAWTITSDVQALPWPAA